MGAPALWDLIKTKNCIKRLPLKQLVIDFKANFKRSPRIAIDAFTWLFECGFISEFQPEKAYKTDAHSVISFLNRLKLFLSLDVTFILVFDGPMKPSFKNKFKSKTVVQSPIEVEEDYFGVYNEHHRQHEQSGTCIGGPGIQSTPTIVKEILKAMNISYIESCSEGEAECARLQKLNLVDYVLSNDSDAFVFGANKVLRNMSKFWEDLPATSSSPVKKRDHKEMFVTIVDLQQISDWNRASIVFFCTLLGADYNQGVRGLGSKKAAKLAQLEEPSFSRQFQDIFADISQHLEVRRERYLTFQQDVFRYCQTNSKELFGRNYFKDSDQSGLKGWPSDISIMHYFHPILSPHLDRESLSGDYVNVSGNFSIDKNNFQELGRILGNFEFKRITNLRKWLHELTHSTFVLKEILSVNQQHEKLTHEVKIVDEWNANIVQDKFRIPYWRVRYNSFLEGVEEPNSEETEQLEEEAESTIHKSPFKESRSPTKKQLEKRAHKFMTSVPKGLIPDDNFLVKNFQLEKRRVWENSPAKKRSSPRKYAVQKNNLDGFIKKHATPRKPQSSTVPQDTDILQPALNPKRRLFVDEDSEDSDCGNSSSLILVSERDCDIQNILYNSPPESSELSPRPRKNNDHSSEDELNESPFKKQRQLATDHCSIPQISKKLLPDNYVDLTIDSS